MAGQLPQVQPTDAQFSGVPQVTTSEGFQLVLNKIDTSLRSGLERLNRDYKHPDQASHAKLLDGMLNQLPEGTYWVHETPAGRFLIAHPTAEDESVVYTYVLGPFGFFEIAQSTSHGQREKFMTLPSEINLTGLLTLISDERAVIAATGVTHTNVPLLDGTSLGACAIEPRPTVKATISKMKDLCRKAEYGSPRALSPSDIEELLRD